MEEAFDDAMVSDFDEFHGVCAKLPDQNDAHVLAAALKTQAFTIVTDNLKHFPAEVLAPLNIEARSTDAFIADTIALDPGKAVATIRQMRESFNKPQMTPDHLLINMEWSRSHRDGRHPPYIRAVALGVEAMKVVHSRKD